MSDYYTTQTGVWPPRADIMGRAKQAEPLADPRHEWAETTPQREKSASTHARFRRIAADLGELIVRKNLAYGDSFARSGEILQVLYPDGIAPEQYDDALAVTRVVDKLFRIANDRDADGESPWLDIAGYGVLGVARTERGVG